MKPLLPTLRETKRYMVYRLDSPEPLGPRADGLLVRKLREALGLFDGARAGLVPVRYDAKLQRGVLRTAHTSVDRVRSALALLAELGDIPVAPRVLGVSGALGKTDRFEVE